MFTLSHPYHLFYTGPEFKTGRGGVNMSEKTPSLPQRVAVAAPVAPSVTPSPDTSVQPKIPEKPAQKPSVRPRLRRLRQKVGPDYSKETLKDKIDAVTKAIENQANAEKLYDFLQNHKVYDKNDYRKWNQDLCKALGIEAKTELEQRQIAAATQHYLNGYTGGKAFGGRGRARTRFSEFDGMCGIYTASCLRAVILEKHEAHLKAKKKNPDQLTYISLGKSYNAPKARQSWQDSVARLEYSFAKKPDLAVKKEKVSGSPAYTPSVQNQLNQWLTAFRGVKSNPKNPTPFFVGEDGSLKYDGQQKEKEVYPFVAQANTLLKDVSVYVLANALNTMRKAPKRSTVVTRTEVPQAPSPLSTLKVSSAVSTNETVYTVQTQTQKKSEDALQGLDAQKINNLRQEIGNLKKNIKLEGMLYEVKMNKNATEIKLYLEGTSVQTIIKKDDKGKWQMDYVTNPLSLNQALILAHLLNQSKNQYQNYTKKHTEKGHETDPFYVYIFKDKPNVITFAFKNWWDTTFVCRADDYLSYGLSSSEILAMLNAWWKATKK